MKLRCISLHQPWASAVALSLKKIETRKHNTYVTGLIGIHAARKRTDALRSKFDELLEQHMQIRFGFTDALDLDFDCLPFGQIVAVAELVDSVPTRMVAMNTVSDTERALGDYSEGRWCWFLRDIRRLAKPIPASGKQGFFFANVRESQLKEAK